MADQTAPRAGSGLDGASFDVVVVGAGFAGMYQLHRLRGLGLTVRVIEAGSGVGGTWYWNRYPGARCDVESMEYSYGFDDDLQQDWHWTERYASQPEILRYAEHVADRFDLRRDITFDTRVAGAEWDDDACRWTIRTDTGDLLSARFVVMATGCLSSTNTPEFPGLDTFAGTVLHTGRWPHDGVDLAGRRVGVIGTGSSAIQSIPIIAEQAAELIVFQRTPNYSVPAHNAPLDPDVEAEVKATYPELRAANRRMAAGFGARSPRVDRSVFDVDADEVHAELEARWARGGLGFLGGFNDFLLRPDANEIAAEFVREKIREVVHDPEVAELLAPTNVIGCKRLCVDTGYYATFNRPNVRLVDVSRTPIERITATGVVVDGVEHPVDVLVLATGFDAMTGTLLRIDLRGVDGATLTDAWAEGPRTYLGLGVTGFPNLFTITGPGSPSVLTNMITSIEQHVEWITDCIAWLDEHGHRRIEAEPDAVAAWVEHVNGVAALTLLPTCNSWYLGANVPGKPRVFMPLPGFPTYADRCAEVAATGYEGFAVR